MTPDEDRPVAPSWLGGRVARTGRTPVLAGGDLAMIALFVALGEIRHAGTVAAGLETLAAFGVAWGVVGTAAGVYAADAVSNPRRAAALGIAAWVVTAVVGALLRLPVEPGARIQPAFVLVTIGFGSAFIGTWRYAAARFFR